MNQGILPQLGVKIGQLMKDKTRTKFLFATAIFCLTFLNAHSQVSKLKLAYFKGEDSTLPYKKVFAKIFTTLSEVLFIPDGEEPAL